MRIDCGRSLVWTLVYLLGTFQTAAGDDASPLAPKLTPTEQQIETALGKPIACHYQDTPLVDVIADLAKQSELPIELDAAGLEDAGLERDTPITLEAGSISLRAVLTLLEMRHQLGYLPGLGGLRITSREITTEDRNQVVRVYPVADLLRPADADSDTQDHYSLIDLLSSHLDPGSWTDNGGTGSISGLRGALVVRQSLGNHHQVAATLAGLRKMLANPAGQTVVRTVEGAAFAAMASPLNGEAVGDLNELIVEAGQSLKIPIVVSEQALADEGVDLQATVTGSLAGQPAYLALNERLRPLHLSAAIFPEFILVASEYDDEESQETRFYSVAGLIDQSKASVPRLGISGWPHYPLGDLIDAVTAAIDPDSWTDNGGLVQ